MKKHAPLLHRYIAHFITTVVKLCQSVLFTLIFWHAAAATAAPDCLSCAHTLPVHDKFKQAQQSVCSGHILHCVRHWMSIYLCMCSRLRHSWPLKRTMGLQTNSKQRCCRILNQMNSQTLSPASKTHKMLRTQYHPHFSILPNKLTSIMHSSKKSICKDRKSQSCNTTCKPSHSHMKCVLLVVNIM